MLKREATYFTPDLTLEGNKLTISGRLWMENPPKYFEKLFKITESQIKGDFEVMIEVDHLNSSSIKQMVMYFKLLNTLRKNGQINSLNVQWKVDENDQEHIALVNDLAWLTDLKIQLLKYSTNK